MFYYLSEYTDLFSPLRVFQYTTFRAVFAAITALLICVVTGPWLIRRLVEMKFQQPIRGEDDLRELAQAHGKKACPTMGGILIIWAVVDSILLWARPTNQLVLMCLATLIWLGGVGFLDDWAKVQSKKSSGMRAKTKFLFQIGLGLFVGTLLLTDPHLAPTARKLVVPFMKGPLIADMGWWTLLVVVVVIVGASNAVNLTDGLDGLATGCTLTVALAYAVMCFVAGNFRFANYLGWRADRGVCRADWREPGISLVQLPSRAGVHGRHGFTGHRRINRRDCRDDQAGGGPDHRRRNFRDGGVFGNPAGREFQAARQTDFCDGAVASSFRTARLVRNQSDDPVLGVVRDLRATGPGDVEIKVIR